MRHVGSTLLEVGMDPVTYRLHDQPVTLAFDRSKTLCPQNRLMQSNFAHRCFQFFCVLQVVALEHERLPAGIMLMKVLMSMFAVFVRAEPGMRMAIKLSLVFEWPIQFRRHLLYRAMMMFVHGMQPLLHELVMQIQSHTQTGIELRMVSKLEEPNFRGLLAHQLFCLHKQVLGQIVDLIENHYVSVFQLLIQDEFY